MEHSKHPVRRCAIYTRKSSEEGLEQDFNSLQAQRENCEAFIRSQGGEGWGLSKTHYDDGGLSGGTMERPKMQITIVGIDLAKNVFRLHGCDRQGRAVLRKQLTRGQLLAFVAQLPACTVAMEACASAHYWAGKIEQLGHRVRLISPRL